jgi:hypothetical protein
MSFEIGSSPEGLWGANGETGGVQNSEDDRDWSFEFWFLIFLDQWRNDNGLFGLLYGCVQPPVPSSVPLLEISSMRNLTHCYLYLFLFLKSGLYLCFLSNVAFDLEMRAKAGRHTLPPY